MFEVGFSEILVIFVLALIVLGPEKLPRVAAQVGKWVGRARAMARQFREQLEEEVNVEAARKAQAAATQPTPTPESQPPSGSTSATPESPPSSDTSAHAPASDTTTGSSEHGAAADAPSHANDPDQSAASGERGTTGESATAAPPGAPHLDLTNEPWPYVAPAPPPEVADVFGDMLVPPRPNAGASTAVASGANAPPPNTPTVQAKPPAAQVHWPHDHDIPAPSPETITENAPDGAQSATHERGS